MNKLLKKLIIVKEINTDNYPLGWKVFDYVVENPDCIISVENRNEWVKYNPTKKEGICDACGGELILRDDDKPETVEQRLQVYHDQTQPLIDYYKNEGILKEVDGTVDLQDVFEAIVKILETK